LREHSIRREAAVGARPTARLSPRGYFVSALVRAGTSVSEVRAPAHHAKPGTTLRYHTRVLPLPSPGMPPYAMAATGIHEQINKSINIYNY
jgi:hypothetical protein